MNSNTSMSNISFDIEQLYHRTFGSKPYKVPDFSGKEPVEAGYSIKGNKNDIMALDGSTLSTTYLGTEIWLPTILRGLPDLTNYKFDSRYGQGTMFLPYAVIRITGRSNIIRTPLVERKGTVKETQSIEDYRISLKGFFIDKINRTFPFDDLVALKNLFEMGAAFYLDNALSNVILNNGERVVITGFDLPAVEGGRKHVRPFDIQLESDDIFTLEL